ncbi:MAG TPA: hypothetical protein VFO55_00675 [Gemmatimonadaceae bacterium]|nr:hypothetical protein [Gemmatimonadaceae bacterium]
MSRNSAELRPQLREAQATLGDALKEACAMDPSKADTGELIHIEELLAIANDSAKKAISVRRRLKKDGNGRSEKRKDKPNGETTPGSHSREFEDAAKVKWVAIAIRPTKAKSLSGPYQEGWLSFDSGHETRRLAPIPEGWESMPDEELQRLCAAAKVSTRRMKVEPDQAKGEVSQ